MHLTAWSAHALARIRQEVCRSTRLERNAGPTLSGAPEWEDQRPAVDHFDLIGHPAGDAGGNVRMRDQGMARQLTFADGLAKFGIFVTQATETGQRFIRIV